MKPILAIDPGTTHSAALLWDGSKVINPVFTINCMVKVWAQNAPELPLAVEMVACYGMPVGKEVFETCLFIGQLQEVWLRRGLPFHLIYRREVKMHLCGNMKAKDGNIRQALIDKLGCVGTKKSQGPLYGVSSHLWSALAVAVTALETGRYGEIKESYERD